MFVILGSVSAHPFFLHFLDNFILFTKVGRPKFRRKNRRPKIRPKNHPKIRRIIWSGWQNEFVNFLRVSDWKHSVFANLEVFLFFLQVCLRVSCVFVRLRLPTSPAFFHPNLSHPIFLSWGAKFILLKNVYTPWPFWPKVLSLRFWTVNTNSVQHLPYIRLIPTQLFPYIRLIPTQVRSQL